jgi:GNAT superfamily N-acetyltransferase
MGTPDIQALDATLLHAIAARWPQQREQLRGRLLWHLHTPYAVALVAVDQGVPLGYALGMHHGPSAWIHDLAVHPLSTGRGVGTALVGALLEAFAAHSCTAQLLVAPPGSEGFWQRFGFVAQVELLDYTDIRFTQATHEQVVTLEPPHGLAVLHLDRQATGEDRETLLREHFYLGQVYLDRGRVRGFLLPLLGHGLIVADAPEVGHELQRWLLPIQENLRLPVGHLQAHAHLVRAQASISKAGTRMVRGEVPTLRIPMIYAHP